MKVSIYKNLTKGCFSIRSCEGSTKGRVIAHADKVVLGEVGFHVGKFGQAKVRRSGHKNVHAFVTGTLIGWGGPSAAAFGVGENLFEGKTCGDWLPNSDALLGWVQECGERFTYNPYKHDGFTSVPAGIVVSSATLATFSTQGNHGMQLRVA